MTHSLVLCDEFKQENNQQNENSQDDYYSMCVKRNKYKIDLATPIKIICRQSNTSNHLEINH